MTTTRSEEELKLLLESFRKQEFVDDDEFRPAAIRKLTSAFIDDFSARMIALGFSHTELYAMARYYVIETRNYVHARAAVCPHKEADGSPCATCAGKIDALRKVDEYVDDVTQATAIEMSAKLANEERRRQQPGTGLPEGLGGLLSKLMGGDLSGIAVVPMGVDAEDEPTH